MASVKKNLAELVADKDNRVVALSGAWGTGKTHLWREVRDASPDPKVKGAFYVSLFGIKDIAQFKLRLMQSALPAAGSGQTISDVAQAAWRHSREVLKKASPAFAALDEIAMLAVPAILKGRFVVIDDIERKNAGLDIDEVMGFIDEFTQLHGARFLLILNSGGLLDAPMWEKFREKVIDHEVVLQTTPEEAFDVAAALSPSAHAEHVKAAVVAGGISNIRIARKAIRAVDRLLAGREGLPPEVLRRVIPPTVLFVGVHLKGIPDGPDEDFVLRFNSFAQLIGRIHNKQDATEAEKALQEKHLRWASLLGAMEFSASSSFEESLSGWLRSGLFDAAALSAHIDQFVAKHNILAARERCWAFLMRVLYDHGTSDEDLAMAAERLISDVAVADPVSATAVASSVECLPGGADIGARMIARWIEGMEAYGGNYTDWTEHAHGPIHPDILAKVAERKVQMTPELSLPEQVLKMATQMGWNPADSERLAASTVEEYVAAIRSLGADDLKAFMSKNVEWLRDRATYENRFGGAMDRFLDACRWIVANDDLPRRARMVRELLRGAGIEGQLNKAPAATPPLRAAQA
ncbi:MAG: hypothetical protein V4505_25380 [Pseudomonadota bacterium]